MRRNKYKKQAPRSRSAAMVCPVSVSTADNEAGAKSATVVASASTKGCGITASSAAAQQYARTGAARATARSAEAAAFANTVSRRGSAGNAWQLTARASTARRRTGTASSAATWEFADTVLVQHRRTMRLQLAQRRQRLHRSLLQHCPQQPRSWTPCN